MVLRRSLALALPVALSLGLGLSAAVAGPVPVESNDAKVPPVVLTANDLPAGAVIADWRIEDLTRIGDTIYASGGFSNVGEYVGPGSVLDATTGGVTPSATIDDGQVSVVVSDGDGGWYVCGDFTEIGGHPAGGVAHVTADGDVDVAFQPDVDGLVSAVALQGDTLWIGGQFSRVDGVARTNLAAVSVSTGTVLPFNAPQSARVTELAYAPGVGELGARLFVGTEQQVSAVDPITGATLLSAIGGQGEVHALLVSGDTLYVGGETLHAYDVATGALDTDFESPLPTKEWRYVHSLLATDSTLYVGTDLGNGHQLVALDPATGAQQTGFTARLDGGVYDLALDGDRLWAGGAFTTADGQESRGVAVLDASTGASTGASVPTYNKAVNAVELSDGQVYVGGIFYMTDWVHTRNLAALDATTLEPKPEFRVTRRSVWGDVVASSKVLYVGDNNFYGYDPSKAAAKSGDYYWSYTSTIDALDPDTGAYLRKASVKVKNLSGFTTIGDRLYVAQRIESNVKFPHNRILVFNAAGKQIDSYRVPMPGYITTVDHIGKDLLLAGSFKRASASSWPPDTPLIRLASGSGKQRTSFNPMINGPIYDLAVQGKAIYASGLFSKAYVDAPLYRHAKRPGLVKLSTAYARADADFAPASFSANLVLMRVRPLNDMVWLDGADRFLDRKSGKRLPDPTGSSQWVYAVAPTTDGRAWSSWIDLNLGGSSYFPMGYVAASAG